MRKDSIYYRQVPSVQWKLINLTNMDNVKHKEAYQKLEKVLLL